MRIKDLDRYGIEHNRCIDDRLMVKCFSHDREFMDFISGDDSVGRARRARRDQLLPISTLIFPTPVATPG